MIIDQIDERSATEGSTQPMPSIDLVLRYTYYVMNWTMGQLI